MAKRADGEGTFDRAPSGLWRYRLMVNGRRVSRSGRTRTEAKRAAVEAARLLAERTGEGTVAELVTAWTTLDPADVGLRPTTRDQYATLLQAHVVPVLGAERLDRLTKRQVADLFAALTSSASTRRSTYAALVKVLDYAVERALVAVNVAREVPRPRAPEPRDRGVDAAGARALLAAASEHRWGIAAWLSLGCGLRRGEVLGLRWVDVDLDRGLLAVTGAVTRSSAGLVRGATKTRRGVRQVPIPPAVVDALKAHRRTQAADRLAAPVWEDSGHVLVNEIGGVVEPRSLSRAWQEWATAAGVADTGTHAGRHYAASTLLASGRASVADVAAQLGHDPAVLLTTYAVAVADGQRAASDALGASLVAPARTNDRTNGGREGGDGQGQAGTKSVAAQRPGGNAGTA